MSKQDDKDNKQDEKRARIIAAQLAREAADREAGKLAPLPESRSNWAASTAGRPRRPGRPSLRGRR